LGLTATPLLAQLRHADLLENPSLRQIERTLGETSQQWNVKQARLQQPATASRETPYVSDAIIRERMGKTKSAVQWEVNPLVRTYIQLYLHERKESFEAVLGLGEGYFPQIQKELEAAGLPPELKYLPVALSALNPRHQGEDGNAGLWHLHWLQGTRCNLRLTDDLDPRMDVAASTRAAAKLLRELRQQHGSWQLAIAAFTCGPAGLRTAQGRTPSGSDFWALYPNLPVESRDYLPAFLAAMYACNFYQEHGLTPLKVSMNPLSETVTDSRVMHLGAVSSVLGLEADRLRDLNPTLRTDRVPFGTNGFQLSLPFGQRNRFAMLKDSIYHVSQRNFARNPSLIHVAEVSDDAAPSIVEADEDDDAADPVESAAPAGSAKIVYKIRSGDNLGIIAERFDVTVSKIKQWNGLSTDKIRAGATLDVYVPAKSKAKYDAIAKGTSATSSTPQQPASSAQGAADPKVTYYVVRSGDNLWAIAKKYPGVTEKMIQEANHLPNDKIKPGQRLIIPKH
jgi:membrane-bound lytic murein transglycosylase D